MRVDPIADSSLPDTTSYEEKLDMLKYTDSYTEDGISYDIEYDYNDYSEFTYKLHQSAEDCEVENEVYHLNVITELFDKEYRELILLKTPSIISNNFIKIINDYLVSDEYDSFGGRIFDVAIAYIENPLLGNNYAIPTNNANISFNEFIQKIYRDFIDRRTIDESMLFYYDEMRKINGG